MATKGLGKNTPKATKHRSPAKAWQLWVRSRRKIARKSPETRQPSPIFQPWGQRLQARDKRLGPMSVWNEFFFVCLEGSFAHRRIVQWDFLRTNHTPQKKSVAADFGSRSDGRSDHGRSRRSRAISRPQRPRDTKIGYLGVCTLSFLLARITSHHSYLSF